MNRRELIGALPFGVGAALLTLSERKEEKPVFTNAGHGPMLIQVPATAGWRYEFRAPDGKWEPAGVLKDEEVDGVRLVVRT